MKENGWTLHEILLYLILLSLLSLSLVLSSGEKLNERKFTAEIARIERFLKEAQLLAVTYVVPVEILPQKSSLIMQTKEKHWKVQSLLYAAYEKNGTDSLTFYGRGTATPARLSFTYNQKRCELIISLRARIRRLCK